MIDTNESRFIWDFGSYCLNYCAKAEFEYAAISICSCHMIVSNHRQIDSTNKFNRHLKFKNIFN